MGIREYAILGLAIALLLALGTAHYYHSEYAVVQADYQGFKNTTKALGEKAIAENDATAAKSKLETQYVQTKLDAALADNKRLQSIASAARTSRGYLPTLPAGSANAGKPTCFDRPKLDAALSSFGTAVAGLIGEGTNAVILRDGWHQWYEGQMKAQPLTPKP